MHRALRAALAMMALSTAARAESGTVNLHLEPAAAFLLAAPQSLLFGVGQAVSVKADFPIAGPAAIEVLASRMGFPPTGPGPGAGANLVGAGVRLRLLDDRQGYLAHWGADEGHRGNSFGNLWLSVDGLAVWTGASLRAGFELAAGTELSVVDGLQLGPMIKYAHVLQPDGQGVASEDAMMLQVGLSLSLAFPDASVHSRRSEP